MTSFPCTTQPKEKKQHACPVKEWSNTHQTGAPFCHLCLHCWLCSPPDGSDTTESACSTEDLAGFSPSAGKVPWKRAWQPTPVFQPGESPWAEGPGRLPWWGRKESDTTEQLSTKPHTLTNPLNLRAVGYLPPVTQLPLTYIRASFYSPLQVSPLFKSLLYSTSLCTKDLHWYLFP